MSCTSPGHGQEKALEESIIRSLNERYKYFQVDEETAVVEFSAFDWDVAKLPPPRSQSWLCCPTAYKPSSNNVVECPKPEPETALFITEEPKFNPNPLQLQAAALSALKTEVLELSGRLQRTEHDRDLLETQLKEAVEERERSNRRLESIGASHESRITEMHCVIVELSKKMKAREETAIIEEQEPEGSGKWKTLNKLLCARISFLNRKF